MHETLSQAFDEHVDFDDVADRLRRDGRPRWARTGRPGRVRRREGSFGALPAETATPLAMVLTELLQNAVEHGFAAARTGHDRPCEPRSGWSAGCE